MIGYRTHIALLKVPNDTYITNKKQNKTKYTTLKNKSHQGHKKKQRLRLEEEGRRVELGREGKSKEVGFEGGFEHGKGSM